MSIYKSMNIYKSTSIYKSINLLKRTEITLFAVSHLPPPGSGVTVKYEPVVHCEAKGSAPEPHILNLLPLRRVTPRLLTTSGEGHHQTFIQEVAEVRVWQTFYVKTIQKKNHREI